MPYYLANLTDELYKKLATFARASGMPMAEVVRRALAFYFQWVEDQRQAMAFTGSDHTNMIIEEAAGMVAHLEDGSDG